MRKLKLKTEFGKPLILVCGMGFLVPNSILLIGGVLLMVKKKSVCKWDKITIKVMGKAQDLGHNRSFQIALACDQLYL